MNCMTVHPHVRGVYWQGVTPNMEVVGPSPRAWGLLQFIRKASTHGRSIPTCVGFTSPFFRVYHVSAVHPHVRGVYPPDRKDNLSQFGPSPRAWGLHTKCDTDRGLFRSIPTCVGFTPCWGPPSGWCPVHPHVRGVYTEIKSKISRVSIKTALLPAEKFKILFLVKIKGSAAAFLDHTIFRDQSPPGLHFEIALHL